MSSSPPSLEIILVNWNGLEDTRACLLSLRESSDRKFGIFVVDNGSDNQEAAIIEYEFGDFVTVLRSPTNLGFTGANNLALQEPRSRNADYVLLLNNDTLVGPGFVSDFLTAAQKTDAGIAGPLIRNSDSSLQSAGANINMWTGSTPFLGAAQAKVDMVSGCCFLIRHDVLQAVGDLDDTYFAYYEESDYCVRAARQGFRIRVIRDVSIIHKGGGSVGQISGFHERQLMRNRLLFIGKLGSPLQKVTTLAYLTLFYLWARSLRLLLQGKAALLRPLWSGFFHGLFLLYHPE